MPSVAFLAANEMESMVVKNLGRALDDVSAMLLVKMKEPAETYLGKKGVNAMMTVLAHSRFPASDHQDAGTIAGLAMMISLTSLQAAAIHMAWASGQFPSLTGLRTSMLS